MAAGRDVLAAVLADLAAEGAWLDAVLAVRLTAPDGAVWSWGPADAAQGVRGAALDLCLLATQRRHRSDTGLVATGPDADRWLGIAQAFAGPPGPGREPAGPAGPGGAA